VIGRNSINFCKVTFGQSHSTERNILLISSPWILPVPECYARLNAYLLQFESDSFKHWDEEMLNLKAVLGQANGGSVLDCSCGWGRQTIALAKLGWHVTATDISATSLDFAKRCAQEEQLSIDFRISDMRDLAQHFHEIFDWVITCYALYELDTDENIQQGVNAIFNTLKPGGKCYLVQRDMDELMADQPRHEFHDEWRYPGGRVIHIVDWDYISDTHVIALDAFLKEDESKDPNEYLRWTTETIGVRKRVLRKTDLERFFTSAGFSPVNFLPKPNSWEELRLVAQKP
jgi:2-polyprenyl-3-methyl-5-hydroxy-6-metoxy-1,4-benzoquinol methylase